MDSKLLFVLGISFQHFIFGTAKSCKIVEQVAKMKESFAYSGQMVRHFTQTVRYEECSRDTPNCCGQHGCCDKRGTKVFFVVCVGVFFCLLFFAFVAVFIYSAIFHRKRHKGEEPVRVGERFVEPRYDMDTYLTIAGYGPDAVKHEGPPRSAVQSTEHHAAESSSVDTSESEEGDE